MGGHGGERKSCGLSSALVFVGALTAGTACSLASKVMLDMKSVGLSGQEEKFSYPLFQTFGMFLGMTAGMVMHFLVLFFRIPFPGYKHAVSNPSTGESTALMSNAQTGEAVKAEGAPMWLYFLLIIPSIFDLLATASCMLGLLYVNVSIYQMLRGSAIVFVALLKHFVLQGRLKKFMWVGIFWNVISILLVGVTAMFSVSGGEEGEDGGEAKNPLIGVLLILLGAFIQSLQYAFEEKVMTMDTGATPPLLLIGMEGVWGTLLCLFVLYPLAYATPGSDHGSFENPFNTFTQLVNSPAIQGMFVLYFFSILAYNILAVLVTFLLDSVWHAILDNFRPVTVWGIDLFIFYAITSAFGESWSQWSILQLAGMFVLLYGTAVYNAPNAGSIKLTGGCESCLLDFSAEYAEVEDNEPRKDPGEEYDRFDAEKPMPLLRTRTLSMAAKEYMDAPTAGFASPHFNSISPFLSPSAAGQSAARHAQREQEMRDLQKELGQKQSAGKKGYQSMI